MPLLLDLLRHGEAAASSPDGDAGRPLTPRGAESIGRLARHLVANGVGWDRLFTSPLLRARQTASILLAAAAAPRLEELAELRPDAEPADVVTALRALGADSGRVLLVSHMPLLGDLGSYLCGPFSSGLLPGQLTRISVTRPLGRGCGMRLRSILADSLDP